MNAVLCTPLRVERLVLCRAARSMRVVRTGMGPRRAAVTAASLPGETGSVLVAGVGGGVAPQVRPGDVVVASEVRGAGRSIELRSAPLLAGALRLLGLTVHVGPIMSSPRLSWRSTPPSSAADDVLVVDMESAQLATADVPCAVVRTVVDSVEHPLWHLGTVPRGVRALRVLRACLPALLQWSAAVGPREILLATPRSRGPTGSQVLETVVPAEQRANPRGSERRADLLLVVGAAGSPGFRRQMDIAERRGVPAHLIEHPSAIDLRWLAGTTRLDVVAADGAPPHLVPQIMHCLGGLGPISTTQSRLDDQHMLIDQNITDEDVEDITVALPER